MSGGCRGEDVGPQFLSPDAGFGLDASAERRRNRALAALHLPDELRSNPDGFSQPLASASGGNCLFDRVHADIIKRCFLSRQAATADHKKPSGYTRDSYRPSNHG